MKKNIQVLCLLACTTLLGAEPWFKQQQRKIQEKQPATEQKECETRKADPVCVAQESQQPVPTGRRTISKPSSTAPKILHLSFHMGCIEEVKYIADKLKLNVTSWYVFDKPLAEFEGSNCGLEIYNMHPDRAQRIWEKHKDYFNQFDIIWISDTAPLSRVFLQNNWKKPLLIWICNRFDYCHWPSEFPDAQYHELFRKATKQDNVWIVPYSPYEWYYAYTKGVFLNTFTIKPIGAVEETARFKHPDRSVPQTVKKEDTMLIYPRLNQSQLAFVEHKCDELGIKYYSGAYNGSHDIKDFKGIIFFIYGAWLNIAMFENFQRGLVHFLPSIEFMEELNRTKAPVSGHPYVLDSRLYELCEWYTKEYRDLIVYYNSWDDLKHKVETTDYAAMKERIIAFSHKHERDMLSRWQSVFDEIYTRIEKTGQV